MALFSGRAYFPLLTSVYAVDTENREELYDFACGLIPDLYDGEIAWPEKTEWDALASDICLVQTFLREIVGKEVIEHTVHKPLMDRLNSFRDLRIVACTSGGYEAAREGVRLHPDLRQRRLREMSVYVFFDDESISALQCEILKYAFEILPKAPDLIARCDSCGNIFERDARHPQQRYCSNRCGNRERLKKFRTQQKKIETVAKHSSSAVR